MNIHAASGLCTQGVSNVGGVTAGPSRHNSINDGGVTRGHVGHNSSSNNNNGDLSVFFFELHPLINSIEGIPGIQKSVFMAIVILKILKCTL